MDTRFALIDLGSNSIRLVLFDRAKPFAAPLLNEKSVVELGRGLDETGNLAPGRIEKALNTFRHFKWLLDGLNLTETHIFATAAVRDAGNAKVLIDQVEALMGCQVQILSGEEVAQLSAKGVLLSCPGARGLVADLGGGSLELAKVGPKGIEACTSLPLGILRLEAMGLEGARTALAKGLAAVPWLDELDKSDRIYLVGGTWRALARAHMAHKAYPLNVLHRYAISAKSLRSYSKKIVTRPARRLDAMEHVPLARRRKLPWAALVAEVLAHTAPFKRVVFSEAGLRKRYDTAIAALIPEGGRFGNPGQDLFAWMAPLFAKEKRSLRDRRRQACQLFDFGWEAHPSYRKIDIPSAVLHSATLTQTHRDRAYLGMVLLLRHGGNHRDDLANPWLRLLRLLPKNHRRHAMVTGRALRLAHKISRGILPLVQATQLRVEDLRLILEIHEPELADMGALYTPALQRLAEALALEPSVEVLAKG